MTQTHDIDRDASDDKDDGFREALASLRAENERLKEDVELRRQQVVNALSVVRADLVVFRTDSALQIVKRILSELSD